MKQREAVKDFSTRPGGPKLITSPPKPERWAVKDTSVNIATAFHQAVVDTIGGGEDNMSGTFNPSSSWASGSRPSQVPRGTSVEYEAAAAVATNRRLPAPPEKGARNPVRKPPSKTTSLKHVPDSEGEEDQSSISHARGKSPLNNPLHYAKQVLTGATFLVRHRSTEPENRSGEQLQPPTNGNESSYEYTAEEEAYQASKQGSAGASANGSAAQRKNRISVDNKAYKPPRESEEESEWSDDGTVRRRRRKVKKGPAGGPLSTLPVVSADKRRKRKSTGSRPNALDDDGSESEENTQIDQVSIHNSLSIISTLSIQRNLK